LCFSFDRDIPVLISVPTYVLANIKSLRGNRSSLCSLTIRVFVFSVIFYFQPNMYLTGPTLPLLVLGAVAVASNNPPIRSENMAPKGKKIQWVGHSFHVFLPSPVASLAREAGIKGHENLGVDFLPASLPCQHWNKGGAWKDVIQAGTADVLTISTREDAPDACVPKFAKLAVG
jgi:hypothetical protein